MRTLRFILTSLGLYMVITLFLTVTALADAIHEITPNLDSYVSYGDGSNQVNSKYGALKFMQIHGGKTNYRKAIIRFNVGKMDPEALSGAELQLNFTGTATETRMSIWPYKENLSIKSLINPAPTGAPYDVYNDEANITWNNLLYNDVAAHSTNAVTTSLNFYGCTSINRTTGSWKTLITSGGAGLYKTDVTAYVEYMLGAWRDQSENGVEVAMLFVPTAAGAQQSIVSKENEIGTPTYTVDNDGITPVKGPRLVIMEKLAKSYLYRFNDETKTVSDVANGTSVAKFMSNFSEYEAFIGTSAELFELDGLTPVESGNISDGMKITVTSATGKTETYEIVTSDYAVSKVNITVDGNPEIKLTEGELICSVDVENYQNKAATLILALYKDGELIKVVVKPEEAFNGLKTIVSDPLVVESTEGITAKIFVIDGFENVRPLSNVTPLVP